MPSSSHAAALLLVLLGLVVTGCRSVPGSPTSKAARAAAESEAELDRRVRAMAAFSSGVLLAERDEPEAAYQRFAQAAENDPGNEALATDLARHYFLKDQTDKAIAVLERTAAQPGVSGVTLTLLADAYARTGREPQAMQYFEAAIRATPSLLAAYQQLAALHLAAKRPKEALATLEKALRIESADPIVWLNVSDLFSWYLRTEESGKDQARKDLKEALSRAEARGAKEPAELVRLAKGYLDLGDSPRAQELLAKVNELVPKNPAIAATLAEMLIREGRLREAKDHLETLSRANPASPMPWYFLGVVALQQTNHAEAARLFERVIQINPDFEPAHADLAAALLSQDDPKAALEALKRGLEKFPASFRLVYLTALAEARRKDYDRSLAAFRKAEALAGDDAEKFIDHRFYFQIAVMLTEAKRDAEAEEYLNKSLALEPDYDEALNHLGYTWAEKGKNLDKALDMIQRALEAEPENPAYLDSLGWVLFRLGRPAEALPQLEKAIRLLPKPDATVLDHLGDVLEALGRKDEARKVWTQSLAAEPSDAVRKKLESPR
ncbi:MAG: tetratricopeptide repeat protein [Limisphaerales bacterium]